MRLWHSKLIPLLDGKRLCDLHMSCCNLRGNGWGKRPAAVGYLYEDPLGEDALAVYHHLVLKEMDKRGYKFHSAWLNPQYCGKNRPERAWIYSAYNEAQWRNVPLKGHTPEIYNKDVSTLIARGLDITVEIQNDWDDCGSIRVYRAKRGDIETIYGIRI